MAGATKTAKGKAQDGRPVRNTTLYSDEIYWASLVATLTGATVAKVISPLVRDALRKVVKGYGIDPDEAWAEYERKAKV